jgi:hypothetical protein
MTRKDLDLVDAEKYLEERVKQYRGYYDSKAVVAKSRFLRMKAFSVLGGALVPALTNIQVDLKIGSYPVVAEAKKPEGKPQ